MSIFLQILLLSITLSCATSARTLIAEEEKPETANPTAASAVTGGGPKSSPTLSFFIHDILGGSAPSGRVVAGMIASTQINGIPFSKPNGGIFPVSNGVPLVTSGNGVVNNKNLPFVAGLNGASTSTVIGTNGNNAVTPGNTLPFVTAGQLPSSLQSLVFGTITVIDDELTEGHELGSSVMGRAQGFYLASSLDGSSHTMAFTVLINGEDHHHRDEVDDTISFFGVHRTAGIASSIAVVGGTGKYEDVKGHGVIDTVRLSDQHTTDGVDTILQLSVYLI